MNDFTVICNLFPLGKGKTAEQQIVGTTTGREVTRLSATVTVKEYYNTNSNYMLYQSEGSLNTVVTNIEEPLTPTEMLSNKYGSGITVAPTNINTVYYNNINSGFSHVSGSHDNSRLWTESDFSHMSRSHDISGSMKMSGFSHVSGSLATSGLWEEFIFPASVVATPSLSSSFALPEWPDFWEVFLNKIDPSSEIPTRGKFHCIHALEIYFYIHAPF